MRETDRLVITMAIQPDGTEVLDYEASEGLRLITALGMLRWAEDALINNDPEEVEFDA